MERVFIKQTNEKECGIAVTCMAINYLQNKKFTPEELIYENDLGDSELSLLNIQTLSEKYGLSFETYSGSLDEIIRIDDKKIKLLSVRINNNLDHFILLYKIKGNNFLIADPNNKDIIWISKLELEKIYNGYFGTYKKEKQIKFENNKYNQWIKYLVDYKKVLIPIILFSLLSNITLIVSSNFIRIYLNTAISKFDNSIQIIVIFFIITLFQLFSNFLMVYFINFLKIKIQKQIVYDLCKRIFEMDLNEFILSKKEVWIENLQRCNLISESIINICLDIPIKLILFSLSSILLISISLEIYLLIIVELMFSVIISWIVNNFKKDKEFKIKNNRNLMNSFFNDIIMGFETLKSKNIEKQISNKFFNKLDEQDKNNIDYQSYLSLSNMSQSILSKIFYFLIIYFVLQEITNNDLSIGFLFLYSYLMVYLKSFVTAVTNILENKNELKIAHNSLLVLFIRKKQEKLIRFDSKIKQIELLNVYRYNNQLALCKNINFNIKQNCFIEGLPGSGKTTTLKVISHNLKHTEGEILINNINNKKIDIDSIKEKMIYISDHDNLFYGSIWENIQNFKNKINIDDFKKLDLLELLNTFNIDLSKIIYNNGSNISVGQKQIINFISVFFEKKDVYIFDNALSQIDYNYKKILYEKFINFKSESLIICSDEDKKISQYFNNVLEVKNE